MESQQEFDPWGVVQQGGIASSTTTLNYTGQRRDDTGLVYYHARYYDPRLGRFLSPDTLVPSTPEGSMDGVALSPLTVAFHDPGFNAALGSEIRASDTDRDKLHGGGPFNPQDLNRYSYARNNPVRYTDPSGHWTVSIGLGGSVFAAMGIRGGVSVAIDQEWNIAFLVDVGGGAYTAGGGSAGLNVSWTNAPNVDKLAGPSVQVGGQIGQFAQVNAEAELFRDSVTGQRYYGVNAGGGVTLEAPFPGELHGTATHTWLRGKINPVQEHLIPATKKVTQSYQRFQGSHVRRFRPTPAHPRPSSRYR
ncbi:MAG: hypothetical protein GFH24_608350n110 [Chloroflexi bacterium AL-N5]|nr:hypothetical protein [Chloroflexi bacterium AL-N5]